MIARPAVILHRAHRRGERGSAFVVALLVLLVLTIAGLALTLMTQTEVRIGANEREANRTFYASDSGINVSSSRKFQLHNDKTINLQLNTTLQDSGATAPLTFADQIVVTPLYYVNHYLIFGTGINQNRGDSFYAVTHVVNSSSLRAGTYSPSLYTRNMAQKLVGSMIVLQPWQPDINYHGQTAGSSLKF
jgi:hypothetical protein